MSTETKKDLVDLLTDRLTTEVERRNAWLGLPAGLDGVGPRVSRYNRIVRAWRTVDTLPPDVGDVLALLLTEAGHSRPFEAGGSCVVCAEGIDGECYFHPRTVRCTGCAPACTWADGRWHNGTCPECDCTLTSGKP